MFHDDWAIPIETHYARGHVQSPWIPLGWSVSSRMAGEAGHTLTVLKNKRDEFVGDVFEDIGDVISIILVAKLR